MTEAGAMSIIGCDEIKSLPSCNIAPHSGVGGCAPSPMNDNELMYKMIFPKSTTIKTIIDGIILGVKWRNNITLVGT